MGEKPDVSCPRCSELEARLAAQKEAMIESGQRYAAMEYAYDVAQGRADVRDLYRKAKGLEEEVARLREERDAITRNCYHPDEDDDGNWFYRLDVFPHDGSEYETDYYDEDEAIAAVRVCAGLKPEGD